MQNTLNLLKRKPETEKGSFIEYIGEILWKVFKKFGELFIKLIKRIIKAIW
jgi:hypothetical protein